MEALGGDQRWSDRALAQHAAVLYYWVLLVLWMAYNFSQLIEAHAVDTYEVRQAKLGLILPYFSAVTSFSVAEYRHQGNLLFFLFHCLPF